MYMVVCIITRLVQGGGLNVDKCTRSPGTPCAGDLVQEKWSGDPAHKVAHKVEPRVVAHKVEPPPEASVAGAGAPRPATPSSTRSAARKPWPPSAEGRAFLGLGGGLSASCPHKVRTRSRTRSQMPKVSLAS